MADFFGNNQRVSSTLLLNEKPLRPAFRLEGSLPNGNLISIEGKLAGACFFSNGIAYGPAVVLEGRTMNGMTMDMKIISAARGMGKEARDA